MVYSIYHVSKIDRVSPDRLSLDLSKDEPNSPNYSMSLKERFKTNKRKVK